MWWLDTYSFAEKHHPEADERWLKEDLVSALDSVFKFYEVILKSFVDK